MDYLHHSATFSYTVHYNFTDDVGSQSRSQRRLQSAQQRVADMISAIGPRCLANPDVDIDFSSDDFIACVNLEGEMYSFNTKKYPLWEMCCELHMLRPDRAEILSAIRKSLADERMCHYKRLVVLETCLAAGKGDVIQAYARGPLLEDASVLYNFFVGKQDGIFLGLRTYIEGIFRSFHCNHNNYRTCYEYNRVPRSNCQSSR